VKQIAKRLTYANVMSSIAVFLVLGGATAFAATKIGSNEIKGNAITTGKIKKEAVTTSKIKDSSITTTKIANDAVTGAKINLGSLGTVPNATNAINATNAKNAENANKLGGIGASSYQQTGDLFFAGVATANGGAEVVRGRGATSAEQIGTGYGKVKFNRNVTNCTWLATYGSPNASGIEGYYASVKGGAESNEVRVVLWDAAGNQVDGLGFHIEVLCP